MLSSTTLALAIDHYGERWLGCINCNKWGISSALSRKPGVDFLTANHDEALKLGGRIAHSLRSICQFARYIKLDQGVDVIVSMRIRDRSEVVDAWPTRFAFVIVALRLRIV